MTSTLSVERLYSLVPAVYRLRDADLGEPLKQLLGAFAEQLDILAENVDQLYDDQFIETCADWVTPYIGDLIGYRPLHGNASQISSPRAEVGNTIALRRRKGTALMLEELAHDVTGWPSHAVEFFQQLATTQYMKHIRPQALGTPNMRDVRSLLLGGGAFNSLAHTAEMRSPETSSGRYNIPNIGIFLWRLNALRLSSLPLVADPGDASGRKFRLNPLGADLRLFRRAQAEDDIDHLSEPINVPEPLSVRLMALAIRDAQASIVPAPDARTDDDYGDGESLTFWRPGSPNTAVPVANVRVCDLRDILDSGGNVIGWNHEHAFGAGTVGFDPERGRVLLGDPSDGPLLATFHYGSAREIGGGEYERTPEGDDDTNQQTVANSGALQSGLDAIASGGRLTIGDSLTYAQTPTFKVDGVTAAGASGLNVVVAARDGARPLIAAGGEITLDIGARGRLVIDGLVISQAALRIAAPAAGDDEPRELVLRDCTLVPGLALHTDGTATTPGAPSLIVENPFATITLERCITGPLHINGDATVTVRDCVIDAGAPNNIAYVGDTDTTMGAALTITESTVIGKVHTKLLNLAPNSIFFARLNEGPGETWKAPLVVERRQEGCARFSFIPTGSITPRRYRCVPDTSHPTVLPQFTSLRYGDPGYGQLRHATDASIRQGADDESEMGVLHALFQPQREANLRIRLDEFLRFGLRAGVFYAT
ncbi:MAG TPA: hypothetical protein VGM82_09275 [Gemmatimonadaceae bacterium]|jgi:hypothetical protein